MFLADTNHEIRAPLQAVMGMTDLLLETPLTKKQKNYLESIHSSGQVLLKIIDDFLDFSALEEGKINLQNSAVDVASVVEPVLLMLGHAAYSKGIELGCRLDVGNSRAVGDPDRMRQVLTNLVGNAIKYTDDGEVIVEVSLRPDQDEPAWVQFAVKDSGFGIDETTKRDLFLPFFRAGSVAARRRGGTGLGLAICKRLVKLMGGTIDIESRVVGTGTNAYFSVPATHATADTLRSPVVGSERIRILVIDDNAVVAQATCRLLNSLGADASFEVDGRTALDRMLEKAAIDPYRIAMIDADLPGMDGVAVAEEIRSRPTLDATGIVMMTSLGRSLQPGTVTRIAARCLDKPIVPGPLRRTIEETISSSRHRRRHSDTDKTATATRGSRILVADDNPVSRQIFSDMAALLGFEVDTVEDGESTLQAVAARSYQLILLDCQMPDLDGCAVAAEIKSNQAGLDCPTVVAISGNASVDDREHCLRVGMDDYLIKPVTLQTMRTTLERWLPVSHPQDAALHSAEGMSGSTIAPPRKNGKEEHVSAHLIDMFITDGEERLTKLSRLLASDRADAGKIAREAHALRTGCLFLKMSRMGTLSSQLEQSARNGTLERARDIFGRLRSAFDLYRKRQDVLHTST
jgi:CheY-like chemotaxis protein/anti-sigma regulatory factor (Ser/Thr protein kinase)